MHNTVWKYHTAVGKYHKNINDDFKCITIKGVTLLKHDTCAGFIDTFYPCDCIYSEISWIKGYEKFTAGTIAEGSSYMDYIKGILNIVKTLNVPTFLVCGVYECRMLEPQRIEAIRFKYHGNYKSCCAVYNMDEYLPFGDEVAARAYVCKKYANVLDFNCGYGNIARDIVHYNKRGVLCDINTECLSYIKKELEDGE